MPTTREEAITYFKDKTAKAEASLNSYCSQVKEAAGNAVERFLIPLREIIRAQDVELALLQELELYIKEETITQELYNDVAQRLAEVREAQRQKYVEGKQ